MLLTIMPGAVFAQNDSAAQGNEQATVNEEREASAYQAQGSQERANSRTREIREDESHNMQLRNFYEAKIRLYNLERNLAIQADFANRIIEKIEENSNNGEFDLEKLSDIAQRFESLDEELNTIIDYNQDIQARDEMGKEFNTIKEDAIALTKEFRGLVSSKLTDDEKSELREYVGKKRSEYKEQRRERIEEVKTQFRKRKVSNYLENNGLENSREIVEELDFSDISKKELAQKIRARLKENLNKRSGEARVDTKDDEELEEENLNERIESKIEEEMTSMGMSKQDLKDLADEYGVSIEELKARVEARNWDIKAVIDELKAEKELMEPSGEELPEDTIEEQNNPSDDLEDGPTA